MKKYISILILIFLSGCGSPKTLKESDVKESDVIYVGDSLCIAMHDPSDLTAQQQVGIYSDCVSARKITDYGLLPGGFNVYFIALGTNDVGNTSVEEYGENLQSKLDSVDGDIWCVLPMDLEFYDAPPYRYEMLSRCPNVIDPVDWGVVPRHSDGIHWNNIDHNNFAAAIRWALNNNHNSE